MTPAEWARCLSLMAALWPQRPVEQHTAEAWFPLLADLPAEAVANAIRRVALEPGNEWPPTVGQIRAAAEPPARPWEDAVAELRRAIQRTGAYEPPPGFDDPALEAVVDAYGWRALCSMDLSAPTVRAQVRDCYVAAQRHVGETSRLAIAAGARRAREVGSGVRRAGELMAAVEQTARGGTA